MSKISKEDSALFRSSIGNVTRLPNEDILPPHKSRPAPIPKRSQEETKTIIKQLASEPFTGIELETGDELSYYRPGIQKQTLRKLKRGQYVIQGELDLHGFTLKEAKPALRHYIKYAVSNGKRCIRIVHGKGKGSKNRLPVLKNKVAHWLRQDNVVLAFCSAPNNDGGTGAVYVLLKKH